jgi:DNA-binding transcriptional regulator YiaG
MVNIRDRITLKACRVIANIRAKEMAEALGVTVDTIYKWERGRSSPNAPQVQKIIKVLANKGYIVGIDDIIF